MAVAKGQIYRSFEALLSYNEEHFAMISSGPDRITGLLNSLRVGDRAVESELIPLIYPELRRIAARYMRRERPDHTLQPTALVHEVYLRVAGQSQIWQNRAHFFAVAAQLMRTILVDYARKRQAIKRGGRARRTVLEDVLMVSRVAPDSILDIDRAIHQLTDWDARQAEIVVFRVFGGLTDEEIAQVLQISTRTVKRDWRMAKAWLHGVLGGGPPKHDA